MNILPPQTNYYIDKKRLSLPSDNRWKTSEYNNAWSVPFSLVIVVIISIIVIIVPFSLDSVAIVDTIVIIVPFSLNIIIVVIIVMIVLFSLNSIFIIVIILSSSYLHIRCPGPAVLFYVVHLQYKSLKTLLIIMIIIVMMIIKNSNIVTITSERSEGEKLFPATRIPVSSPNWNGTQPWPYRDCDYKI